MSDVILKTIGELTAYQGPGVIPGIRFRTAGRDLGITAWGMNVLEIDAGCTAYPEHDHRDDGQEEVYCILRGSGTLHAGDRQWPVEAGSIVRVGPAIRRKFTPGPGGVTLLAIGATPGKAYSPRG